VSETLHATELERVVPGPPPLVWALLADTNRWDRAMGAKPSSYSYERKVEADPRSRTRVGRARQMGVEVSWVEVGEWIESRFLIGEREFLGGPFTRIGYRLDVAQDPDGARVKLRVYFGSGPQTPEGLTGAMEGHLFAAAGRYLDAIAGLVARSALPVPEANEPPASLVRRMLLNDPAPDRITVGKVTPPVETELTFRAARLAQAPVAREVRDKLLQFLRERPDEELRQVRPFELARAWGMPRREVLRTFLYATRAGLLDLDWQINCPTCRVGSETRSGLSTVGRRAHCDECEIDYDVDFAENIEAVFRVSSAIRDVQPTVYCAGAPSFRPHVFALLRAPAGERRELEAALPEGLLLVRALRGARRAALAIGAAGPAQLVLRVGADEVTLEASGVASGGVTRLSVINETGEATTVALERAGWNADVALGSVILTLPEFHDLFGAEAPAAGVELSVSSLSVLFSDLSGTTALYEQLGDARAFALVQEHFRQMAEVIGAHEGALVKTMGDAVMATFRTPADALAAALDMQAAVARGAHPEVGIKVGVHEGACLVVRANERLDFFGSTVNLAARLQAQARPGRVVVLARLLDRPEVGRLVAARGLTVERFSAPLKGLRDAPPLAALG